MDAPTLLPLLLLCLSSATSAFLLVLALRFGYAGHLVFDIFLGAVIAILLMLAYPPPPGTPDWARLLVWGAAIGLSHGLPRLLALPVRSAWPRFQRRRQRFESEVATLNELFEFEEVKTWDEQ